MKRTLFLALALAFLLPAAGVRAQETSKPSSQPDQSSQNDQGKIPVFRKNVNLVNVLFTVKGKHDVLIPNLEKDHFEIFEDGKPQTIKYFSALTDQPLTIGLLIDSSYSMNRTLPEEKIVAGSFLQKVLTDKDLAFVISFDISVDLLQDLTGSMHLLREGLDQARINVNTAGIDPMGRSGPVPTASGSNKGTLLYDAIYLASDEVLSKEAGRKAIIILTDGDDVGSKLRLKDAIESAQRADVIAYVLLITDPGFPSGSGEMNKLTEETGGRLISVSRSKSMDKAFSEIAAELRSQYTLAFTSTNTVNDGRFRRLEVKSKDGYKIQARKGYYPPNDKASNR